MGFPYPGEVSERFKEHAWKACVGETQPWVRIPPSPPFFPAFFSVGYKQFFCLVSVPPSPPKGVRTAVFVGVLQSVDEDWCARNDEIGLQLFAIEGLSIQQIVPALMSDRK